MFDKNCFSISCWADLGLLEIAEGRVISSYPKVSIILLHWLIGSLFHSIAVITTDI